MTAGRDGRAASKRAEQMEPLTGLVLYRTPRGWQYAVYAGGGVMDGRLLDTPLAADEGEAQAALLGLIETWTGRSVEVTWRADGSVRPDWWTAEARFVP